MSVSESEKECPLCMEALDWDDLGFFPCSCGYQICRFCWHRLRTDENGLCPACRQAFPDMPVSFNPEISAEELKKQKKRNKERRSNKDQVFKPQDLATLRVVQKNLVFVIGLSSRLTQDDLKKEFAHFGRIIKFVHNKSTAYITYSKPEEAIRAIRTLNTSASQQDTTAHLQFQTQLSSSTNTSTNSPTNNNNVTVLNNSVNNSTNSYLNAMSVPVAPNRLKASLGTTKYCNHFLRSQQCPKVGECMYLHEIAEAEASFTKEQMQAGKHVEYEKKLMDSYISKMDWHSNLVAQNNGFRVSQNNALTSTTTTSTATTPQQQTPPIQQNLTQQVSSQIGQMSSQMNSLGSSNNMNNNKILQINSMSSQSTTTPTSSLTNIPRTTSNITTTTTATSQNNGISNRTSSGDMSPNHLSRTLLGSPQAFLQATNHQSTSDFVRSQQTQNNNLQHHSVIQQNQPVIANALSQATNILNNLNNNVSKTTGMNDGQNLSLGLKQSAIISNHQRQQFDVESDSEDDGLDFDPISVSTSGLRDLLNQQQVQQDKQMQMHNYIQQLNGHQTLESLLFQQHHQHQQQSPNNRLNLHQTNPNSSPTTTTPQTNGPLGNSTTTLNGHPQSTIQYMLANLSGNNLSPVQAQPPPQQPSPPQQQQQSHNQQPQQQQQQPQVSWQNLSAWTNFIQRSGYGFENSR